ncbi:hypothetical protein BCT19_08840 [Vibrio splendidus]|uniref:DUF3224 domain-containing protein n=1 Tax=Vibrio splendidus TaxID=29497 RepID=UPI000CAC28CB|nr:DUF3224 domain-containing protein [Vibrio splendidus]PMN97052.1 hypothetical protein BCT19_08840 [Vibrio splendidus]
MSNQLNGTFQITGWDENPYNENDDGSKQTNAKITQNYSGDIEGSSELQYLMSYSSNGSAIFVGLETLSCTINGKSGRFVIKHNGKFEAGVASSEFTIAPDSGTKEFVDITGSGTFKSGENGQANYTVEINA